MVFYSEKMTLCLAWAWFTWTGTASLDRRTYIKNGP